jgi:hypothetical protein
MLYKGADFPNMRVAAMGHFSLFYQITRRHDQHHSLLGQPARSQETIETIKGTA